MKITSLFLQNSKFVTFYGNLFRFCKKVFAGSIDLPIKSDVHKMVYKDLFGFPLTYRIFARIDFQNFAKILCLFRLFGCVSFLLGKFFFCLFCFVCNFIFGTDSVTSSARYLL